MGFSTGSGSGGGAVRGGGRRRRRGARSAPMSEINVTPFVDVMLVLLIVFMVAAPLLTVGVPIDLPQSRASQVDSDIEPLRVSIDPQGRIFLQETEVTPEELIPRLEAISENGYDQRIFVRGDQAAGYGTIIQVMGLMQEAGFTRFSLESIRE